MPQLVYISNIQKFSTHDGPGIRTNVFFKGCSMECQWCANPETIHPYSQLMFYKNKCSGCGRCIDVCPNGAVSLHDGKIINSVNKCKNCGHCVKVCRNEAREMIGKVISPEEVFRIVNQDKVFYEQSAGGVTFSGGEPLLHPDFIGKVAAMCKAEGYNTAVETCGNFCMENVEKIIDLIDYALFDIKIIDEDKHIKYCGKSNRKIHKNFEFLMDKVKIIPRVPIIPSINDTEADIAMLCRFFRQYQGKFEKINILPYHNLGLGKYDGLGMIYKLNHIKAPDDEHMNKIKANIESCGFKVEIGG